MKVFHKTNFDMLNSVVMFIYPALDKKYIFLANLVQKIQIY